jgi:flagellar basal body-associated protein FliL
MSEKAEKKADAAAAAAAPAAAAGEKKAGEKEAKGGLMSKTPVLLGGVMLIEAVVLFAGFKVLGGHAQQAPGAELQTEAKLDEHGKPIKPSDKKTVEVPVMEAKALNRTNGRTFVYDISIFVVAKSENEQKVKDTFKDNKALIEDRIATIIAESDPDKLGGGSEPGLETLRRQVKYQLDRVVGEGVIDEVLVPRCIPFRTDY